MMNLKKTKKRTWIVISIAVVLAIVVFSRVMRKYSNGSVGFGFVQVERGDIENAISSTGTLNAKGTVEVGTQVSGTIDKVFVDFNDKVRKNQILAVLDTTLLAASVREAEATLRKTHAQYDLSLTKYEDAQELYKNTFISELDFKTAKVDYETANAALLSAQANLERAQANLKYAVIRSPINGTVINRSIEPGQTVAASFSTPTLFVITEDLSQMEIHAYVDESDIGQIKEEQSVRFTVDAYPDEIFTGSVREIRLQPETIQNVVNYTVVVDARNNKGLLLPGMTATVDFLVEEKKDILMIANSALRFQPTQDMLAEVRDNMPRKINAFTDSINRMQGQITVDGGQQTRFPSTDSGTVQEPSEDVAVLWYIDNENRLGMMYVHTGVTDGANTEIVEGGDIKEGMAFISNIGEQNESNGTSSDNQQRRRPGPPPLF